MPEIVVTLREMLRRAQQASNPDSRYVEELIDKSVDSGAAAHVGSEISSDPLDRESIISKQLSELSDSLSVRYRQVRRDLRDESRLAWNSQAHELRDILAHVLRTLAPSEEVVAQSWYKQVEGTDGPTHAQRARYALSQVRSKDDAKNVEDQVEVFEALISRIARATYTTGSALAHNRATYEDCFLLLLQFETLMFSLLTPGTRSSKNPKI